MKQLKAHAAFKPTPHIQETVVQVEESTITHAAAVKTQTESVISLPPTDSILRRHYDTLINNELNRLLEEQ